MKILAFIFLVLYSLLANSLINTNSYIERNNSFQYSGHAAFIDKSGVPHVFYGNSALKHAKKTGGIWNIEIIEDFGAFGAYVKAVELPNNEIMVLYTNKHSTKKSLGVVKQAIYRNGEWLLSTTDLNIGVVEHSIGMFSDSLGNVYNLYYADRSGGSQYRILKSSFNGMEWADSVVAEDASNVTGGFQEFGAAHMDKNDVLHLAYKKHLTSQLVYGTYKNNNWTLDVVRESAGNYAEYEELAVTVSNSLVVSLCFQSKTFPAALSDPAKLICIDKKNSQWDESVFPKPIASSSSIKELKNQYNKSGNFELVYSQAISSGLSMPIVYGEKVNNNWVVSSPFVKSSISSDFNFSLLSGNKSFLVYMNNDNSFNIQADKNLKFSTFEDNTTENIEEADWGSKDVGRTSNYLIDNLGNHHAVYTESGNVPSFKYAKRQAGSNVWSSSKIYSGSLNLSGSPGDAEKPLLYVDESDVVHVFAYCDGNVSSVYKKRLCHFYDSGSGWVASEVDEGGAFKGMSLVESEGKLNVVYFKSQQVGIGFDVKWSVNHAAFENGVYTKKIIYQFSQSGSERNFAYSGVRKTSNGLESIFVLKDVSSYVYKSSFSNEGWQTNEILDYSRLPVIYTAGALKTGVKGDFSILPNESGFNLVYQQLECTLITCFNGGLRLSTIVNSDVSHRAIAIPPLNASVGPSLAKDGAKSYVSYYDSNDKSLKVIDLSGCSSSYTLGKRVGGTGFSTESENMYAAIQSRNEVINAAYYMASNNSYVHSVIDKSAIELCVDSEEIGVEENSFVSTAYKLKNNSANPMKIEKVLVPDAQGFSFRAGSCESKIVNPNEECALHIDYQSSSIDFINTNVIFELKDTVTKESIHIEQDVRYRKKLSAQQENPVSINPENTAVSGGGVFNPYYFFTYLILFLYLRRSRRNSFIN